MRNLLAIFAIIAGVCIAFSDELINKTALTIKTSDPFNSSIFMSDIDSITFSNEALDGSLHDSVVTKRIHVSDSVLEYALDSIQGVTFDDVSEYINMNALYIDLASYLGGMIYNNYTVENLLSEIETWLHGRNDIVSFHSIDNNGIEVEHVSGLKSIISFNDINSITESEDLESAKLSPRSSESMETIKYHNITSHPSDTLLYKSEILYFQGRNSYDLGNSEPGKLIKEIEKSPLDMHLVKNETEGDLNFLVKKLPETDVAIISYTHGIGDGGFQLSDNWMGDVSGDLISPVFQIQIEDGSIFYDSGGIIGRGVFCVRPEFFLKYATGRGIGLLNYCWSYLLQQYLQKHLEVENKVFVGYYDKSYRDENILRSKNYLANILHGCTHSEAVSKVNEKKYSDGVNLANVNNYNARLFSIVNLEPMIRPDYDDCHVLFVIRGWKNLKKDIKGIKIWYKGEPFTQPEEDCRVIEHDFSEYPKNEIDWSKDRYTVRMWPCPNPESYYTFSEGGPDYYVGAALDGIESDSLYYTVGFEYDDGETKNIYHSDVMAIGGITYGVTPGQCIDMGLPSGTKWAAWNMGATNPEEEGGTYGWGEPTGTYTEQPYSNPMAGGYDNFDEVVAHYGGENPASDISGSSYDIAHVKWGDGWRLPTVAQWEELMNDEFTLWQEYTLYGVDGIRVISKINNNKIFFPVKRDLDYMFSSRFWTSELDETSDNKYSAKGASMSIHSGRISKSAGWSEKRWSLLHVRPVKK